MKERFFRIISPITFAVVAVLDIAIILFAIFSVRKLMQFANFYAVLFAVFEIAAIILAVFVTKDVVTQGIKFREDEMEFTALDENNIFRYDEISSVDVEKDDKASLVKNFNDRQSKIIFTKKDGSVVTVEIGITSKKTLSAVKAEIIFRITSPQSDEITAGEITAENSEIGESKDILEDLNQEQPSIDDIDDINDEDDKNEPPTA